MLDLFFNNDVILFWIFGCMVKRGKTDRKGLSLWEFYDFILEGQEIESKGCPSVADSLGSEVFSIEMETIHGDYDWRLEFLVEKLCAVGLATAWNTANSN